MIQTAAAPGEGRRDGMTGMIEELSRRISELERRISILEDPARPRALITDHDFCGHCSGTCSPKGKPGKKRSSSPGPRPSCEPYQFAPSRTNSQQVKSPPYRIARDVKDAITRESPLHGIVIDHLIAQGEWEVYEYNGDNGNSDTTGSDLTEMQYRGPY